MQHKYDSLIESLINTAVGFVVSYFAWLIIAAAYGIAISTTTNLQIIGWFTVVSIARQYIIRRLFNGRSIWESIKR